MKITLALRGRQLVEEINCHDGFINIEAVVYDPIKFLIAAFVPIIVDIDG